MESPVRALSRGGRGFFLGRFLGRFGPGDPEKMEMADRIENRDCTK